jgi:hypothetical protein
MKRLLTLILAATLTLSVVPAADAGGWFCPSAAAWYPQVQLCRDWRWIGGVTNADRSAEWWSRVAEQERQRQQAQAAQEAERARAEAEHEKLFQQDEARKAANQKRYEAIVAQREQQDVANGYRRISVKDFALDGKDLAREESKISIQGVYKPIGELDLLFQQGTLLTGGAKIENGVPLLTENAPRKLREYLYNCKTNAVAQGTLFGCPITVLGRATLCQRTLFGVPTTVAPCIDVDDAWFINPNNPPEAEAAAPPLTLTVRQSETRPHYQQLGHGLVSGLSIENTIKDENKR